MDPLCVTRIPRTDVILARHPIGTGGCFVRHRAGLVLGEVLRWPDGVWVAYVGPVRPGGVDEKSGEGTTREEAVEVILSATAHCPSSLELRSGTTGLVIRDATEAECRQEEPEAWAWWDQVRPLLRAGVDIC